MLLADIKLFRKSLQFKPDIFISFASPYAAQVAWLSGKPHIVLDDTEHTRFAPFFYKPFSKTFLNPSCYQKDLGRKQLRFDSFTELFYLHKNYYTPNPEVLKNLGLLNDEKYALLRFVSWKALHDIRRHGLDMGTKKQLINSLEVRGYKVFISDESEKTESKFNKYLIKIPSEYIHDVLFYADLFVSEGGTMASEAAILGTPVVYVNSLPLMGYLQEEQKHGLLSHFSSSNGVIEKVEELLSFPNLKEICQTRKQNLITGKIDPTAFLVWFVENYPESLGIMKKDPDYQLRFKIQKGDESKNKIGKILKVCSRCILDTTVSDIWFDNSGECKYCKIHDEMELSHPLDNSSDQRINEIVTKIKYSGRKKQYDCVVGVSGGRDSTYTLYTAVKLGLRPLAVHFDNGWNTEISVKNIKKGCEKLKNEKVAQIIDLLRKRLQANKPVFLYDSIFVPVDSVLDEKDLAEDFDLTSIRKLGLLGWDIVQAVPKTIGIGLKNMNNTGIFGEEWGGGIGGNVVGVYIIIRKTITLSDLTDDSTEDEVGQFILSHLDNFE